MGFFLHKYKYSGGYLPNYKLNIVGFIYTNANKVGVIYPITNIVGLFTLIHI